MTLRSEGRLSHQRPVLQRGPRDAWTNADRVRPRPGGSDQPLAYVASFSVSGLDGPLGFAIEGGATVEEAAEELCYSIDDVARKCLELGLKPKPKS